MKPRTLLEKANTLFHVNFAKTTHEKAKQTAAVWKKTASVCYAFLSPHTLWGLFLMLIFCDFLLNYCHFYKCGDTLIFVPQITFT